MSVYRSAFALQFKEKVGSAAMEYLTRWRMRRAGEKLLNSADPISLIAFSLGYKSESAFGFAFKREMGYLPRQYCHARTSASAAVAIHYQMTNPLGQVLTNEFGDKRSIYALRTKSNRS